MKRMLIAAHGRLAEGLKSAVSLIMGEKEGIDCINAFVTDTPLEEQVNAYAASIGEEDQVLVVTDAFFGSVNQKLMEKSIKNSITVTGVNLPLLLELAGFLEGDTPFSKEQIKNAITQAQKQLMLAEPEEIVVSGDDFEL